MTQAFRARFYDTMPEPLDLDAMAARAASTRLIARGAAGEKNQDAGPPSPAAINAANAQFWAHRAAGRAG